MPLAILREAGRRTCPLTFTLDDSMAMAPEFRAVELSVGHRRCARVEIRKRRAAERRSRRLLAGGQDRRDGPRRRHRPRAALNCARRGIPSGSMSIASAMATDVDVARRSAAASPGSPPRSGCKAARRVGRSARSGGRAGGVIGTIHRDGALYETGPNSALDTTPLIDELLDALGIRGERVDTRAVAATRFIVRDGQLVAAADVARALLVHARRSTLGAKLRALARAVHRRARRRRRGVGRRVRPPPARHRVPRLRGRPVRRRRLCRRPGAHLGSAAFPRLHALEQRYGSLIGGQLKAARERRQAVGTRRPSTARSFSFRNGMQTLTDALARAVTRVATGVHVDQASSRSSTELDRHWHARWRTVHAARPQRCHSLGARGAHCVQAGRTRARARAGRGAGWRQITVCGARACVAERLSTSHRRSRIPLAGFGFLDPAPRGRRRKSWAAPLLRAACSRSCGARRGAASRPIQSAARAS